MKEKMIHSLRKMVFLCIVLLINMLSVSAVMADEADGADMYYAEAVKPKIFVKSLEGEYIMAKSGDPIYSSSPLQFAAMPDKYTQCYYSLCTDKDDDFGMYIKMYDGCITLYPDENLSPEGQYFIKFKAVTGEEGTDDYYEAESDVYWVIFDDNPIILEKLENIDVYEDDEKGKEVLKFYAKKDAGYIRRIIALAGEEILYEKHFSSDEEIREYAFEIPVSYEYYKAGGAIKVCAWDEAGSYKENVYYNEDAAYDEAEDKGEAGEGIADTDITDADKAAAGSFLQTQENVQPGEDAGVILPPVVDIIGAYDGQTFMEGANLNIQVYDENYEGASVHTEVVRNALGKDIEVPVDDYELMAICDTRKITLLRDGDYDIKVTARDKEGNESVAQKNFKIDSNAPDVYISGIEDKLLKESDFLDICVRELFYEDASVNVKIEKADKDKNMVSYLNKDYKMSEASCCFSEEIKEEGDYTITVSAEDSAGNCVVKREEFSVDKTSPQIASLSDIDGKYLDSFSLRGKFERLASDKNTVSVKAYVNDGEISENDIIIGEGKYKLKVVAEDAAGNVSQKDATFVIDHTKPQVVIEGADPDRGIVFGSTLKISLFDEEDTLEGVTFNDRNVMIKDNTAVVKVDETGAVRLSVKAVDAAGNVLDKEISSGCVASNTDALGYTKLERTISKITSAESEEEAELTTGLGKCKVLLSRLTNGWRKTVSRK